MRDIKKAVISVVVLLAIVLTACSGPATSGTGKNVTVLCDVEKFANISSAQLVAILGEPDNVEKTTTNGFAEFPCVYYEYNNAKELGEVSFILINDAVVKLVSYHNYAYNGGKTILESFNLTAGDSCASEKKDNYARYRSITDKVDDLWVTLVDKNSDTFECLQVTYDMFYFEEWYMAMNISEKSDYQYWTKESVNSILKAPKTAKYPGIMEWSFGKNPFYTAVQSYVDAQNSFGAQVRSKFHFVYKTGTNELVYAVFDNEVLVDNGYVDTEKLVSQLVDESKTNGALTVPQPATPNTSTPENNNEATENNKETTSNQTPTTKPSGTTSNGGNTAPSTGNNNSNGNNSNGNTQPPVTVHTHTYGNWTSYDNAQHQRSCTTCYETEYGAHSWDGGTVTQTATCSAEGVTTFACSTCGGKKTESIAKADHDFSQKVESSKYLKQRASYTNGSTYYYSCSCGEKGTETFSLNDRKEWINAEQLYDKFGYSATWMGDYIHVQKTDWSTGTTTKYMITGSPTSKMEAHVVYSGTCNGHTVRFKSEPASTVSGGLYFNYDDLVAAGIL